MKDGMKDAVKSGLPAVAAALPDEVQAALETHRRLLEQWRKAMDLVGPGPVGPHFEDAVGSVLGLPVTGRWADLGSGAGFPGVALAALFPEARVELVESRQKRAVFLRKVVMEARLSGATVVHGRSEALEDGVYDGVISRAYKQPEAYLAYAARLLRPGGLAVLLTGDADLDPLAELGAFEVIATEPYPVGEGFRRRVVLRRG